MFRERASGSRASGRVSSGKVSIGKSQEGPAYRGAFACKGDCVMSMLTSEENMGELAQAEAKVEGDIREFRAARRLDAGGARRSTRASVWRAISASCCSGVSANSCRRSTG